MPRAIKATEDMCELGGGAEAHMRTRLSFAKKNSVPTNGSAEQT